MTAGLEPEAAMEWLYATLSGDNALRSALGVDSGAEFVFESVAPEDTPLSKYVVFQVQAATDVMVVGAQRIFTNLLFVVRAVGQGADYIALGPAASRIDELLHRSDGATTADGVTWGAFRVQPFRLSELTNGQQYRHAGGLYRVYTSS